MRTSILLLSIILIIGCGKGDRRADTPPAEAGNESAERASKGDPFANLEARLQKLEAFDEDGRWSVSSPEFNEGSPRGAVVFATVRVDWSDPSLDHEEFARREAAFSKSFEAYGKSHPEHMSPSEVEEAQKLPVAAAMAFEPFYLRRPVSYSLQLTWRSDKWESLGCSLERTDRRHAFERASFSSDLQEALIMQAHEQGQEHFSRERLAQVEVKGLMSMNERHAVVASRLPEALEAVGIHSAYRYPKSIGVNGYLAQHDGTARSEMLRDKGEAWEPDPASVREIILLPRSVSGLAFDGTNLWVARYPARESDNLYRVDPSEGRRYDAEFPLSEVAHGASGLAVSPDAKSLWIALNGARYFQLIDLDSGKAVGLVDYRHAETEGSQNFSGLAFDGQYLWVNWSSLKPVSRGLLKFDPRTRQLVAEYSIPKIGGLAWDGVVLWTAAGGKLMALSVADGSILKEYEIEGLTEAAGIAWGNGGLWVAEGNGRLLRIEGR